MSKIKNENYICIQGFMVNELKLKGNELLIYAIIYGFAQDGDNVFTGSLQYLADWTNSTRQGVIKCLKSLVEKKYICKEEYTVNNVKFCKYTVVNKVYGGSKQSLQGVVNKVAEGSKQSLHNNIINNISNNINDNTPIPESESENKKEYPKEAEELTTYLYSECQKNDTHFKRTEKQLNAWISDFEKLHRIDGREWTEITAVLKWAKQSDFWKPNILSASKFRQKYEMLYSQMQSDYKRKGKVFMKNDVYTGGDW